MRWMKSSVPVLAVLMVAMCATASAASQEKHMPKGIKLVPTGIQRQGDAGQEQLVKLVFIGGKVSRGAVATVKTPHTKVAREIPRARRGLREFNLYVPNPQPQEAMPVKVTVALDKKKLRVSTTLEPMKPWKVYLLPHSHVDIGYTNLQEKVKRLHMRNIDDAIALAKKTQHYPEEARYQWNVETLWAVESYYRAASPKKKKQFIEAVRKGWIHLDAAYGSTNTSVTSGEQLLRMFSYAQFMERECQVDIAAFMQVDVPGASWGVVEAAAQNGIKYFLSGPNASARIGFTRDTWEDRPFYWVSPSGKERILFFQTHPYSLGYQLKGSPLGLDVTADNPPPLDTDAPMEHFLDPWLLDYLAQKEATNHPYRTLVLTWAMVDNAPLDLDLPDAVRMWNEQFASPKLTIASTREAMEGFESEYGDQLPVMQGDYTEYWTDGVGSAARETAMTRIASERMVQAEALWAMVNPAEYPADEAYAAWRDILLFSEHTWGAHNSVSQPDEPFVKQQWAYKQAFALQAAKKSEAVLRQALPAGTAKNTFDVYNTASWERTDLVTLSSEQSRAGDRILNAAGQAVSSQRLSTGELIFLAGPIPPLAAKRFKVVPGKGTEGTASSAGENRLENSLYRLNVDNKTGAVASLIHKPSGRELVAKDAATAVNEYFYLKDADLKDLETNGAVTISVKENGPLVVSLLIESAAPGCNTLRREVRLIEGIDRVELINVLDKQAIRDKEAVHIGFGFNVPEGAMRIDIPWGVMQPEKDQIPGSNKNWMCTQRWVDVSNDDYGVTWSSLDAPLMEVGEISANVLGSAGRLRDWRRSIEPTQTLYSWALNNHWFTNFPAEQSGDITFRYAVQGHGAYDSVQATRFGMAYHQPLVAAPAAGKQVADSLLTLSNDQLVISSVKPANDGHGQVVRLYNPTDTNQQTRLQWPGTPPTSMSLSSFSEAKITPLADTIDVPARGLVTIRVQ